MAHFLKFFLIGGTAAVSDLVLLYLFTEFLGWHYLVSASVSFVIVTASAFFAHKTITFACERKDLIRQMIIFFAINLGGLALYAGLLHVGVEYLGFYYMLVAFVSKFIVFVWNFLANKFITFSSRI